MPESNNLSAEQRRLRRRILSEPVHVYDRVSQSFMGRLVNIHTEGLMIMGNHPFTDERIYQLDLQLPVEINGRTMIPLGVDCLWSRSEDDHVHWAGCKIIDVSTEALRDIELLMELLGEAQD